MAKLIFWRPNEDAPPLHRQIEEEHWQNLVAPVRATMYQPLPYQPDAEDIPEGQLFQPSADEDYWLTWVVQPARQYQPLPYLPDADDLPAGSLRQPTVDEEYCYWVAPLQGTLYRPLPYLPDADDVPAGSLFQPVVDEDFWSNSADPEVFVDHWLEETPGRYVVCRTCPTQTTYRPGVSSSQWSTKTSGSAELLQSRPRSIEIRYPATQKTLRSSSVSTRKITG